mmetsp:Transcript_67428/g.190065  ORF Transcript_67428/g.190065 Transcript_67428/m.190065 type:complete len:409 (+) Transcript_67428:896-2122(+)
MARGRARVVGEDQNHSRNLQGQFLEAEASAKRRLLVLDREVLVEMLPPLLGGLEELLPDRDLLGRVDDDPRAAADVAVKLEQDGSDDLLAPAADNNRLPPLGLVGATLDDPGPARLLRRAGDAGRLGRARPRGNGRVVLRENAEGIIVPEYAVHGRQHLKAATRCLDPNRDDARQRKEHLHERAAGSALDVLDVELVALKTEDGPHDVRQTALPAAVHHELTDEVARAEHHRLFVQEPLENPVVAHQLALDQAGAMGRPVVVAQGQQHVYCEGVGLLTRDPRLAHDDHLLGPLHRHLREVGCVAGVTAPDDNLAALRPVRDVAVRGPEELLDLGLRQRRQDRDEDTPLALVRYAQLLRNDLEHGRQVAQDDDVVALDDRPDALPQPLQRALERRRDHRQHQAKDEHAA